MKLGATTVMQKLNLLSCYQSKLKFICIYLAYVVHTAIHTVESQGYTVPKTIWDYKIVDF